MSDPWRMSAEVTTEMERLEAENARLREALEDFSYGGPVMDDQGRELEDYCRITLAHAVAIMDWLARTSNSDWLTRHDEEIRHEERGQLIMFISGMKLANVLSENNRLFNVSCDRIIEAISEEDS